MPAPSGPCALARAHIAIVAAESAADTIEAAGLARGGEGDSRSPCGAVLSLAGCAIAPCHSALHRRSGLDRTTDPSGAQAGALLSAIPAGAPACWRE
jgi:hypothetical protein